MGNIEVRENVDDLDLAVIGMAGRFPGAKNVRQFWENLANGVESVTLFSESDLRAEGIDSALLKHPNYVKASSVLEDADLFDAEFFGYSPREAELMDPQQRVFLECAWEALEDAGYAGGRRGLRIGVYASSSMCTYLLGNAHRTLKVRDFFLSAGNIQAVLGNGQDFLATRVSYKLNLKGPSVTVQTACSSSLVAVHLARQSLLGGECDIALAGGVSIYLPQRVGYVYDEGLILSPDGHCRVFDADAAGTIFGRGAGIIVLKRFAEALANGDQVLAVLKGSAINNDGSDKVGYTAPSVNGQTDVIAESLANAGIEASTIGYVEAHGTGTAQGDPIEIAALTQAFRATTQRRGYCAIGSVKSNIGHLDAASGIAGFIKTVLVLQKGQIPPTLHYRKPNPRIDFGASPFYVNATLSPWKRSSVPRRAGVSSFGMGGTNCHVVLEEAPRYVGVRSALERPWHLLALSARDERALHEGAGRLARHLSSGPPDPLADVCFTANVGRSHFVHRLACVGRSSEEVAASLATLAGEHPAENIVLGKSEATSRPLVAFLFTGQGSQYADMGRQLYETSPMFRRSLDRCAKLLQPHLERPLLSVLFAKPAETPLLDETRYTQPALFALEYSLACQWRSWGIEPSVVMGHSVGELVAATLAGVLTLEDGLQLVAERGRLISTLPHDGAMGVVFAGEEQVAEAILPLSECVSIAAINGPRSVTVSGKRLSVEAVLRDFEAKGVGTRPLTVSHAFHSPLMDPILDSFESAAAGVRYGTPQIDLVSDVTGRVMAASEVCDARYWRTHLRAPVRFAQAVKTMCEQGCRIFLEIGPHPTLARMGPLCSSDSGAVWLYSLQKGKDDWRELILNLGQLYVRGAEIDWLAFDEGYSRKRLSLPTYPFQRKRFWIECDKETEPGFSAENSNKGARAEGPHPLLGRRLTSPAIRDRIFELWLGPSSLSFVRDHQVCGKVLLPMTAYIEMVLAAAGEDLTLGEPSLADLAVEAPLTFSADSPRRLQVVLSPEAEGSASFRIFSQRNSSDAEVSWVLHAAGQILREHPQREERRAEFISGAWLESRGLEGLSGDQFYELVRAAGFEYGPTFRGIEQIWRDEAEVFARVQRVGSLETDAGFYALHPAFFDACLQAVLALPSAAEAGEQNAIYLPVGVRRCWLQGAAGDRLWSHVRLVSRGDAPAETLTVDVHLWDEKGNAIGEALGITLRRTGRETVRAVEQRDLSELLYRVEWRPCPSWSQKAGEGALQLPSPTSIAERLRPLLEPLAAHHGTAVYNDLGPQLDRLVASYVLAALRRLGWQRVVWRGSTVELVRELGIVEKHRRLFGRLLEMLREDGIVDGNDAAWTAAQAREDANPHEVWADLMARYPTCGSELTLVGRCGDALADVLCGVRDPLEMLFPGGDLTELERLYRDAPFTRAYNSVVQETVRARLEGWPKAKALRVLEVGAGTGGTASFVLPLLPPNTAEYVFTDVSPLFLSKARAKFSAYPFVHYEILDIERDPVLQGYAEPRFDMVLATNVLHATRDLRQTVAYVRQLLTPGGCAVIVEGMARQRWVDLIFGLTPGWWRFSDAELRPGYPLISKSQWLRLLTEVGFAEAAVVPDEDTEDRLFAQAVIVAQAHTVDPRDARHGQATLDATPRDNWLIFADRSGVGSGLAQVVRAQGRNCCLAFCGATYQQVAAGHVELNPAEPEDFRRLLADLRVAGAFPCRNIVYLWGLDASCKEDTTPVQLDRTQQSGLGGALHLVQALANVSGAPASRLWLVTRGTQEVADAPIGPGVVQAPVWGLGKVVALEHPELQCVRVDLDPTPDARETAMLLEEIQWPAGEDQLAFRGGQRFVPRLCKAMVDPEQDPERLRVPLDRPYRLETPAPGPIERLRLTPAERRPPGRGEVEIRVLATGLNFKDLMAAMGIYPGDPGALGGECAGEIVALGEGVGEFEIGQSVVALAPGSFASFVTVPAAFIARKPAACTFEEAATMVVAFLTASHALERLARVSEGDRVLIHAAAGGVGLAAVQVAQRAGACVWATAGSARKRDFLRSLGVQYVMNSRTTHFAEQVMESTAGEGVDVVLNSLADDFIPKSLLALKPAGRYVEIGKRGIWSKEQVSRLKPGVSYYTLDMLAESLRDPVTTRSMLADLMRGFEDGSLKPLPFRVFGMHEVVKAFRHMAQAKHIGKIIVSHRDGLRSAQAGARGLLRSDGTYLITGGLGGLGILVARWMAEQGARHVVLLGRHEAVGNALAAVEELRRAGVQVATVQGDVAVAEQVAGVVRHIAETMPPLRGVLHAAGVLNDGVLLRQNWTAFEEVMRPKVRGAWNLHVQTRNQPLDFFVLFSSLVSLVGSAGQGNHVAANAFLDALAHYRKRRGLPALSINWGAWSETGAVASTDLAKRIAARGFETISPREGIPALERLVREPEAQFGVASVHWPSLFGQYGADRLPPFFEDLRRSEKKHAMGQRETAQVPNVRERIEAAPPGERRQLLAAFVHDQVVKGLALDPMQPVDRRRPLQQLGLDSLLAVELRNLLGTGLGLRQSLPATLLFDYPSVEKVTEYLETQILGFHDETAGAKESSGQDAERQAAMVKELEQMSDAEAEALLLRELDREKKGE